MEKYILDTSVLVADPNVLLMADSEIIIPSIAIRELDGHKKRNDEVGRNARYVSRFLDKLRDDGALLDGVYNENGSVIRIEPGGDPLESNDRFIIECAAKFPDGILLTKDINVRIAADALGIRAQDYTDENATDPDDLYKGWRVIEVSPERINKFYTEGKLSTRHKFMPNEFALIKDETGSSQSAVARYDAKRGHLVPLRHIKDQLFGIHALNVEQKFAIELLATPEIELVSFVGKAGTGKTLLALAAGMQGVLDEGLYRKMYICRPIVPVGGKDLGAMPGDFEEKMAPWATGIVDNLDFLIDTGDDDGRTCGQKLKTLSDVIPPGRIDIIPLSYLRGRSLRNAFILIDEAQNITPKEMKTIISRAGEGSKVVLTGDIQQIDHLYLDQMSNGLTHLVERFKGQEIYGHVTMTRTERSRLADLASELL
jgi:PhoH-like ATPase